MSARVAVTKLHGTRNDFILVDARLRPLPLDLAAFAQRACDRHTGIGADGLLLLEASAKADVRMRIINADGSEAEMCGNGIRCVVRFIDELTPVDELRIETLAGIIDAKVLARGHVYLIRVKMPAARVVPLETSLPGAVVVDVGNPHVVLFEDRLEDYDLLTAGARLQHDPAFANGANLHVARVTSPETIDVRHYERGAGLTMACGTGAVAVAVAARAKQLVGDSVRVSVPGGELAIDINPDGSVFMSGQAARVFETTVAL